MLEIDEMERITYGLQWYDHDLGEKLKVSQDQISLRFFKDENVIQIKI